MGLIHGRASKQRDREQAALLREERLPGREEAAGDSLLRQPIVGALIRKVAERRRERTEDAGPGAA